MRELTFHRMEIERLAPEKVRENANCSETKKGARFGLPFSLNGLAAESESAGSGQLFFFCISKVTRRIRIRAPAPIMRYF